MGEKAFFRVLCDYAKSQGFAARNEESKAKDYTQHYFSMYNQIYMSLYEGEKRTLRGHDKPEVCWICIDYNGKISSIPSRTIRTATQIRGFGLSDTAKEDILDFMGYTRRHNELNNLLQEA